MSGHEWIPSISVAMLAYAHTADHVYVSLVQSWNIFCFISNTYIFWMTGALLAQALSRGLCVIAQPPSAIYTLSAGHTLVLVTWPKGPLSPSLILFIFEDRCRLGPRPSV